MENKTRITPYHHSLSTLEDLVNAVRQGKKTEGIQLGKEEIQLSLLAYDITDCVENPKYSTKIPGTNSEDMKITRDDFKVA